jgi:DNA polymerase III epsilon subunit-like protein
LIAFDLETTGLEDAHVVEFGASIFRAGAYVAGGSQYAKPGKPIEDQATGVHKITNAQVANKPPFADFLPRLRDKFESTDLVVGYNCVDFDVPIIDAECERAGFDWRVPRDRVLDLKPFVDFHHRGQRSRKQGDIGQELYDIRVHGRLHSAATDTRFTGDLLLAMVARGLVDDDVARARVQEAAHRRLVDEEFKNWSYWLYHDRKTRRMRMGAGKHCGSYVSDVEKRTLSWYLNNIDDLPEAVRKVFLDAKEGRFQNELQESMVTEAPVKTAVKGEDDWGGW